MRSCQISTEGHTIRMIDILKGLPTTMRNGPATRVIRKNNHRNIIPRIVIGLVVVIALSSAFAIYFKQEEQIARIRSERIRLDAEIADVRAKNEGLKDVEALVDTDAYIEWVARNQLGMVRPDEIILTDG
jgi:cell division protein FtsB